MSTSAPMRTSAPTTQSRSTEPSPTSTRSQSTAPSTRAPAAMRVRSPRTVDGPTRAPTCTAASAPMTAGASSRAPVATNALGSIQQPSRSSPGGVSGVFTWPASRSTCAAR